MRTTALVMALVATLPLSACGEDADGSDGVRLTVLAAASLTEPFTTIAEAFEAGHDGVTVELAFDSSATLAQQVVDGAPGDVLATADAATMRTAVDAGAVADGPEVFATNVAVLVTPAANPAGITSIADLDDSAVTYVACVDSAPCGTVAAALLEAAEVSHPPASLEVDVKAVLARVTSDEADAGIVYATDAVTAGDAVTAFEIDGADAHRNAYPIATLEQSAHSDLAGEFLDYVRSADGRRALSEAGFGGVG